MKLSEAIFHIIGVSNNQLEKRFIINSKEAALELSEFLFNSNLGGAMYGPFIEHNDDHLYEVSIFEPVNSIH